MRIGIMLRVYNETGGIGVYTRNIVKELLEFDRKNEYLLFYHDAKNLGTHAGYDNVNEVVVNCRNKALWDQVALSWAARREGIDVLFNPKFTVPLVIYLRPNEVFRRVEDPEELERVKAQYQLPEKCVLSVIRYDEGTKNTRMNLGSMARAIARCKREGKLTHKWVVVSLDRRARRRAGDLFPRLSSRG